MRTDDGFEFELFVDEPAPPVAVDVALTERASAYLTEIVGVVRAATAAGTYRLRLPPELAGGVASGELSMMPAPGGGIRATVIDARGQIVGSGALHEVAAAPLVAAALWKLAAKITAHHFLAEIDGKLASIETKLDAVRQDLQDLWKGRLHGSARKLGAISRELLAEDLSERELQSYLHVVETIDTDARAIAVAAEHRGPRLAAQLDQFEPEVSLRPGGATLEAKADALHALLRELDASAAQEYVALYVRVLAAQVRATLTTNSGATQARVQEISDELAAAARRHGAAIELARQRIADLKGRLTLPRTEADTRRRLLDARRDVVVRAQALAGTVEAALRGLVARLANRATHAALWVQTDAAGRVVAVHRLPEGDGAP
jgi:hypothetical protein